MGSAQSDLQKCQVERDNLRNQYNICGGNLGTITTERDNLRNQYNTCNSQYNTCSGNLGTITSDRDNWRNQYNTCNGTLGTITSDRDNWRNQYNSCDSQYTSCSGNLTNMTNDRDNWLNKYNACCVQTTMVPTTTAEIIAQITTYNVIVYDVGLNTIPVYNAMATIMGITAVQAKQLFTLGPVAVAQGVNKADADKYKNQLLAAGAPANGVSVIAYQ
jgi:ribosomal protein L7/L12